MGWEHRGVTVASLLIPLSLIALLFLVYRMSQAQQSWLSYAWSQLPLGFSFQGSSSAAGEAGASSAAPASSPPAALAGSNRSLEPCAATHGVASSASPPVDFGGGVLNLSNIRGNATLAGQASPPSVPAPAAAGDANLVGSAAEILTGLQQDGDCANGVASAMAPPFQRRSGPPSQSTLNSSAFRSSAQGSHTSSLPASVPGYPPGSPKKKQVAHLRSAQAALRRKSNGKRDAQLGEGEVFNMPPDFPQGPYTTLAMHMDKVLQYAKDPSLGGGIFDIREKETKFEGTKRVGPWARLVCNREGQPPSTEGDTSFGKERKGERPVCMCFRLAC